MISNAVANTSAGSGPVRSGQPGRASGETDSAFRDVLDKSAKTEAEASGQETEPAEEARPRTALADTRWHRTLENVPEEQSADSDAETDLSGEDLIKDAKGQVPDAAADAVGDHHVPDVIAGQGVAGEAQPQAGDAEDAAAQQAVQMAGVAAKAASPNAAKGLDRAGEVASENARLPVRGVVKNGEPAAAAGTTGDTVEETTAIVAGKRSVDAQPAGPEVGARKAPATGTAGVQGTGQPANVSGEQDREVASGVRVTGDMQTDTSRVTGDPAKIAAKPTAEPSGVAVRTAASADVLPGAADAPVSRQIADAVAREMEELAPSRLSLTGSTAQGGRTVKTMRLQLNPAELGTVNIRLQSVNGELRVTIQADSDQTSRMLHNDSDAIRSALRTAGIGGADVVVANNRNDSTQSQNFGAQHRDPSGGQQAGAQENRQNASNESRQSYRESSSNDSTQTQVLGGDTGDNGNGRGRRITI
jgi:chemotaxis protein MotD